MYIHFMVVNNQKNLFNDNLRIITFKKALMIKTFSTCKSNYSKK